ncbi:response regulator [Varibaculum vaginae]|uniref:response regulator n=1 Tax=Varibaculum vaginae TaxID=2364797 RepID=UPI000F076EA0|nr:response regulator [Varibaculum vaginae]
MAEAENNLQILLYSDDREVRRQVITGVGIKPAADLPKINWDETATATITQDKVRNNRYDLLILDGEATKISGISVAKSLAEEDDNLPPILILTARPQDEWLAGWAGAAKAVERPLTPLKLQEAVSELLR